MNHSPPGAQHPQPGKCKRLEGQVALVTAATAGIGAAIVQRLAEEGASVFLCSRKQDSVDKTVQALTAQGFRASGCACHVGDPQQLKHFAERGCSWGGGHIDILVSNAAVSPAAAPITDTAPGSIDKILDINVKSAVLLVQAVVPYMQPGATIVFITSVTAYNPPMPIGMYAVSKTALLGLTKGLAAELGPQGIRVNAVAPGIVPTKLSSYLVQSPELAMQQVEATALKRLGTPQDMAAAVAFLVSPDAGYVTGETLVVAGGMPSKL